jgi:prophage maintenance system killer protein
MLLGIIRYMRRIDLIDFVLIAETATGVSADALLNGYCRLDQVAGALAVPFTGFGNFEAYPKPNEKAAAYCEAICRYHPLVDGNKRTGYFTMVEFAARNGYDWEQATVDEAVRAVEMLAEGTLKSCALRQLGGPPNETPRVGRPHCRCSGCRDARWLSRNPRS